MVSWFFPDLNYPLINLFFAKYHIFGFKGESRREAESRAETHQSLLPWCIVSSLPCGGLHGTRHLQNNIPNIKHPCFLLARHCHFSGRGTFAPSCSLILSLGSFLTDTVSTTLLFLLLSATHSFVTLSSFFRRETDKITLQRFQSALEQRLSTAICVFFYSCHASQTAWGITLHSQKKRMEPCSDWVLR